MSDAAVRSIGERAAAAAADAAWAQWSALTSTATPARAEPLWTIVDPEALVLVSLAVRAQEGRMDDVLAAWARTGAWLLSVQRLNTLARGYPAAVAEQVGDFARWASDAGDRRWERHATPANRDRTAPRHKETGPLRLTAGPSLMLRLRAGMGVGAKADLLTLLLGLQGAPAELRALSGMGGYSDRALRTAADEMALAGLIQALPGSPLTYRADVGKWGGVLIDAGLPRIPPWHPWATVFAFLAGVVEWCRQAEAGGWSAYVASSRARDLVAAHEKAFRHAGIFLPDATQTVGAAYLGRFGEIVELLSTWTEQHLYG